MEHCGAVVTSMDLKLVVSSIPTSTQWFEILEQDSIYPVPPHTGE